MKKILCILLMVFVIFSDIRFSSKAENGNISLHSESAVLIDAKSGRVLYGKNEDKVRPMASTTKIMSLIVALEYGDMNQIVEVSANAQKQPEVKLGIKQGEKYYMGDLLYSMMLESHNDSAVAVGEGVAGSEEAFIGLMNKKAEEIGLESTCFRTINGLDKQDDEGIHQTTSYELALIMRYCIFESPKSQEFIKICTTKSYSFTDISETHRTSVSNKNRLLYSYPGMLAGKTGFTSGAGYCYVCAVQFGDRVFIVALLGAGWPGNKGYKWEDTNRLLKYGEKNYNNRSLVDENYSLKPVTILNSDTKICHTHINEGLDILISDEDRIKIVEEYPDYIYAPRSKNREIGEITVYINDEPVARIKVYIDRDITKKKTYYIKPFYDYSI